MILKGKTVILGVSGGIAAYKSASLASMLIKSGAKVHVIMTEHATNFIHPITFETLTRQKCLTDTFDRNFEFNVEHVELAKAADVIMIAPATANVIAKAAHGIADDMLTTTLLACKCPKIIVPAMNTRMYENPITQDNINTLKKYGMEVVTPATGYLACGDTGAGKMPEPEILFEHIVRAIAYPKDMEGKKVLVTAGPTQEKMGYAIARQCMLRGAQVTLVSGKTNLKPPMFVEVVSVISAKDMYEAVIERSDRMDIIIKAAAVADYRPANVSEEKMKKTGGELSIELERTQDILQHLGTHKKEGQFLCGFSMETQNMLENSRKKLEKKNLDMIAANNLKVEGAGFGTDTNIITLITKDMEKELEIMTKAAAADEILDEIMRRMQ